MEAIQKDNQRIYFDRDKILERDRKYWAVRRMSDVVLSLVGVVVLWPLMLLVAILIVIDSPGAGPVFAQTRIGRDGKPFVFYS